MDKNDIIEYVMNTPHNTNRAVLSSMLNQLTEGGDGSPWTVLTEESVTTASAPPVGAIIGALSYEGSITANTIKVTLDGNEYILDATISEAPGGLSYQYGGEGYTFTLDSYDGDEEVAPIGGRNRLLTETAGTYTIKIEVPQSSGSSDFSTAQVTIVNNTLEVAGLNGGITDVSEGYAFVWDDGNLKTKVGVSPHEVETFTALLMNNTILPTGKAAEYEITVEGVTVTTTGDCRMPEDEEGLVLIYGDCTITIGEAASTSAD